jgi:hypothetical protein
MAKIVISYRRSDSAGITGRIFDRLTARYGDAVFMDVDKIPFGIDFRKHIRDVLSECDVLIVVVGARWLGFDQGKSRIHDEDDPVRVEIEAGLQRNIPIIPALVEGAAMPKASELPDSVRDFAFRNAIQIDSGRDFNQHAERLIRAIDHILQEAKPAAAKVPSPQRAAVESSPKQGAAPASVPGPRLVTSLAAWPTLITGVIGIAMLATFLGIMLWWVKALPLIIIVFAVLLLLLWDFVQELRGQATGPRATPKA